MTEIPIPLSVVQLTEETGQAIAPEVGDTLTLTIEGQVTRSGGDQVWVKPRTINGQEIPEASEIPAEPTGEEMDAEMAALMGERY